MKRITKIEATKDSKRKLRVAAYARVSTGSDEQLVSLETQKNHYERYIKARPDWDYAGLYYDEGITGTKKEKREGLLRMLADCDKGLIDYIVVKSISRFARNTVDSIEMVRNLCEKGIYIYFEKENIDTGKMEGELLLSILSSLAESESRSISTNITWGIQKRFANGTYKIGYPPYGYDNVDGQMLVNEEQARTVRWIFGVILEGKSLGRVAKELNANGTPTKKGGRWTAFTINGMVKNEKYTGDVILQKTYTDDSFNRHVNHGDKTQYYWKNHHAPIVSHEVFEAANAILKANGQEKGIGNNTDKYKNRYAMSGKIICGECGSTCKRVKLNNHFGFACNTHARDKEACGMKTIPENAVKAAFVTMMNKLTYGRSRILLPFAEMLKAVKKKDVLDRLNELEDLLEKNTERSRQVNQFYTKGLLDPAVHAEESEALGKEREQYLSEKRALEKMFCGSYEQKEALARLLKYTARGSMLTEYEESLFAEHVDHIVVYERTEIGFAMKCGPVFRERL